MITKQQQIERYLKLLKDHHEMLKQCHHNMTQINSTKTVQGKMIEAALGVMFTALWETETYLDELKRLHNAES